MTDGGYYTDGNRDSVGGSGSFLYCKVEKERREMYWVSFRRQLPRKKGSWRTLQLRQTGAREHGKSERIKKKQRGSLWGGKEFCRQATLFVF